MNNEIKQKILAKFSCQKSGNCCRAEGYVYASEKEMIRMAAHLNMTIEDFKAQYVIYDKGWSLIASERHRPNCFLNEKNQCAIYPERPTHCRTYPDWPEIWESHDAIIKETFQCPALKKAYYEVTSSDS